MKIYGCLFIKFPQERDFLSLNIAKEIIKQKSSKFNSVKIKKFVHTKKDGIKIKVRKLLEENVEVKNAKVCSCRLVTVSGTFMKRDYYAQRKFN